MKLESMNKAELVQLAKERQLDTDGTKAELVERLLDDGYTDEDGDTAPLDEPVAEPARLPGNTLPVGADVADLPDPEAEAEEEPEVEPAVVEETRGKPEKALVRLTSHHKRYDAGRYTFTREHPYVAVDKDDLLEVLSHRVLREASFDEVKEYYS